MKYILKILRRASASEAPHWQSFALQTDMPNATVATALSLLNQTEPLYDLDGNRADRIRWDCGCLQKKCGACAMRINGAPRLACDARLAELKGPEIRLEPLRKFPVVADLVVNRQILYENLKTLRAWLETDACAKESENELLYEASRCLQCGCCLEICPNFYSEGRFFGMAAMSPTARLLAEMPAPQRDALRRQYRRHIYNGCGKSLACRDICPAGIAIEKLLVNSNAIAVWKK